MMKIKKILGLLTMCSLFILSSCSFNNSYDKTINNENQSIITTTDDTSNEIIEIIEDDILKLENTSSQTNNNLELNDTDFFTITNTIQTETILANVRVEASFYSSSRGRYQLQSSSIGSGVIIKSETIKNKTYYYCLTNNHVVYNSYSYASYVVEDVYENEYQATLIYSLNTYDLALIRFESKEELYVIELEDEEIISGYVAAIGEANAKSNTLTYGYLMGTETFEPNESEKNASNVTFDVLIHTSYIEPGSSGGALLDMNLKLIGINFASRIDDDSNWEYSYAIPLSKILEFLDLCYDYSGFCI